jgi:hypothetical protein
VRLQIALAACLGVLPPSVAESQTTERGLPPVTVSRRTTFVTLPKRDNGFVDLAGAIDLYYSHGVTPETNAATLLFEALGHQPMNTPLPTEFFDRLGMPQPPAEGEYFVSFNDFLSARGIAEGSAQYVKLKEERLKAARDVWSESSFPELAEWLKVNDRPLETILRAAARPKYFVPILRPQEATGLERAQGLMAAHLPHVQAFGDIAFALAARATLRVNDGDLNAAWADILTLVRLGRLSWHGPNSVEVTVSHAISQLGHRAALVYIDHGKPYVRVVSANLRDFSTLPAWPDRTQTIHVTDRMMFVDAVLLIQDPNAAASQIIEDISPQTIQILRAALDDAGSVDVDWDEALATGHRWFDKAGAALRKSIYQERATAIAELRAVISKTLSEMKESALNQHKRLKAGRPSAKEMGRLLGGLTALSIMSDAQTLALMLDRSEQSYRNLRVALALAAFKSQSGAYPERLEELKPAFLKELPHDLFTLTSLKYKRDDLGYVLYSVGPNGRDDGGFHRSANGDEDDDDEAVTMPWK